VRHPSEALKKGEEVEAVILNINVEQEKLSLGVKQLTPDPWEGIENKYPVGANIKGEISQIAGFGAIVELDGGIEGLIPSSELEKLAKSSSRKEPVKVGDEVSMKITRLDPQNRKLGLSISAYHKEAERKDVESYLEKQNEESLENKIPLDETMNRLSAQAREESPESTGDVDQDESDAEEESTPDSAE
jgi:small subunit ribosomal protein S1